MGLLIAVGVPVINPLDTLDGVAQDSLGNVGANTSARHERTSSSSEIVERPAENPGLLIKLRLAVACAANVATTNAGEDVGITGEAWLRVDDVERGLRQHQRPGCVLLTIRTWYAPLAVNNVLPPHADNLLASLTREQGNAHQGTEDPVSFGCRPQRTKLIVFENARSGACLRVRAPHAPDDG